MVFYYWNALTIFCLKITKHLRISGKEVTILKKHFVWKLPTKNIWLIRNGKCESWVVLLGQLLKNIGQMQWFSILFYSHNLAQNSILMVVLFDLKFISINSYWLSGILTWRDLFSWFKPQTSDSLCEIGTNLMRRTMKTENIHLKDLQPKKVESNIQKFCRIRTFNF